MENIHPSLKYLRSDRLPTIYCPGCGVGIVLNVTLKAIEKSGLDFDKFVFVSGIGCSSRVVNYIKADTFHTTHGRAIAVAEGVKLANPDLHVVVFTGDGDAGAIGGNHLIHAARRNMDLTVVCINNMIYGLTGGQASPTTPIGARTETSHYGNFEGFFDLSRLVAASGANYVARWTTYHVNQLSAAITKGLKSEGFAFIEALSQCPVEFGKKNSMKSLDLLKWLKENSVPVGSGSEEQSGKIMVGEFANRDNPSFVTEYKKLISEAKGGKAPHPGLHWGVLRLRSEASEE